MRVCYLLRGAIVLPGFLFLCGCEESMSTRSVSSSDRNTTNTSMSQKDRPTPNATTPSTSTTTPSATTPNATTSPRDGSAAKTNTEINARDRDPAAKTPIDQDENSADINVTASIRKKVVASENLSVNARNVKIITSQGKVTLRGPVSSAQERDLIVKLAQEVAGNDNVDNQLEIAR